MRYLICFAVMASMGAAASADPVQVQGHVNRDGTYVQPHVRTAPNSTINDNWSTKPNYNPYTGRQGTRNPEPSWGSTYDSGSSRRSRSSSPF